MRRKSGSIRIRSSSGVSLAWRPAAGNNLMTFHRRRADVAWGIIKLLKLLTSAASQSASAFTHPSIAQLSIKDVPPPRGERLYMHIYQSRMLIPASASRLLIVDVPPRVLFVTACFYLRDLHLKTPLARTAARRPRRLNGAWAHLAAKVWNGWIVLAELDQGRRCKGHSDHFTESAFILTAQPG